MNQISIPAPAILTNLFTGFEVSCSTHRLTDSMLLLLSWRAHQAVLIWGGRGANAPKRWGIPPDCYCLGTHLWRQRSHQSTTGVLLPTL